MQRLIIPQTLAEWNERGKDYLPGHLGMEFLAVEPDEVRARMRVQALPGNPPDQVTTL